MWWPGRTVMLQALFQHISENRWMQNEGCLLVESSEMVGDCRAGIGHSWGVLHRDRVLPLCVIPCPPPFSPTVLFSSRTTPRGQFLLAPALVLHGYEVAPCLCLCAQSCSHTQRLPTLWIVAHQAPPSMGLSQQEYWTGLLVPPPGNLPGPGIEPVYLVSLHWQTDSLPLHHLGSPRGWLPVWLTSSSCHCSLECHCQPPSLSIKPFLTKAAMPSSLPITTDAALMIQSSLSYPSDDFHSTGAFRTPLLPCPHPRSPLDPSYPFPIFGCQIQWTHDPAYGVSFYMSSSLNLNAVVNGHASLRVCTEWRVNFCSFVYGYIWSQDGKKQLGLNW